MLEKLREELNQRELRETWQRLTRTDKVNVNEAERLVSIVGGLGLTVYGLTRRSPGSLGSLVAGGYLLYRGLSGHCPLYERLQFSTASRTEQLQFKAGDQARYRPSLQQQRASHTINTGDNIDETALETFPASDSPGWTSTTRQ